MSRGFSLIEVAVSLAVLAVLVAGAASLLSQPAEIRREDETISKLIGLKYAITGDPRIVSKEARTDFGYIGAMGSLPPSLESIWIRGSQNAFSFNTSLRLGSGWAGPYVPIPPARDFPDIARDGWGNLIRYEIATAVSSTTGQTYRARLISLGPDGTLGSSDDLTVEIYETDLFATIAGYVRDANGNPLTGVSAELNYPSAGTPVLVATTTDAAGAYTFSGIPFGNRSLNVKPKLVYVAGTAFVKGGAGSDVEFVVQNFSANTVSITSFKAEYDVTAFYETLQIGKNTVFNNSSNRAASGQTLTFAAQTVAGTGSEVGQIVPIRVQSGFTLALDQNIGQAAQAGATVRIKMKNFKTLQSGGTDVDMTGISIRVTFSDGSIAIFSPER